MKTHRYAVSFSIGGQAYSTVFRSQEAALAAFRELLRDGATGVTITAVAV